AAADPDLMRGVVFIPMHWGARFLGGESRRGVNELTLAALDPSSRQPEFKHCAVRVERAQLPWRLVAFGNSRDVFSLVSRLELLMGAAPYAVRTLIGRDSPGVRFAIAAEKAPQEKILEEIDAIFGLDAPEAARYDDSKHNIGRRILLEGNTVRAVRLSGDTRSEPWLKDLWERAAPVGELRRYLLLPVETPPGLLALRGRTVCNCFNVSEREIDAFLAESNSITALQASLKCGTNCGSCLPELRRKVSFAQTPEAGAPPLTAAKV
ncbi:MAG TPA: molybdopterin dinucleotide binding domain-containing protein, partial [Burkholderiales bacterium]|nr:molybdopterin dinucleotide binding domain-containing protein [Burkholderiales bacterium]